MPLNPPTVTVQVIIPARNEEDCLGHCLESLVHQQGVSYAITVVDDGSTDRTRAIAESFPGVRVISAGEPQNGFSGKCNALMTGVESVSAKWLLFTDADTFHYPGSLAAAVKEGEEQSFDLLSYSPEQETGSWYERMLMPVVYAELTRTYPTEKINDPADPAVAANGQYILVRRAVYQALGGHQAVAHKLLEDVELARIFKQHITKSGFALEREGSRRGCTEASPPCGKAGPRTWFFFSPIPFCWRVYEGLSSWPLWLLLRVRRFWQRLTGSARLRSGWAVQWCCYGECSCFAYGEHTFPGKLTC